MEAKTADPKDIPWYRIPVQKEVLKQFTQRSDPRRKQMVRWARVALASYVVLTVVFALLTCGC